MARVWRLLNSKISLQSALQCALHMQCATPCRALCIAHYHLNALAKALCIVIERYLVSSDVRYRAHYICKASYLCQSSQ